MFATMARSASVAVLCALLTGCGSSDPIAYRGLASSSNLRPDSHDESGRVPYRYSAKVDWRSYSRVIIDPVVVYQGSDNQFGDMSYDDRNTLASYMQSQFTERLASLFQVANSSGPETLRVRLTLTGAETTPQILGTFTHFDLAGNLYNGVQAVRGGEGMISGSVFYAVEVYDAQTSRLLSAYITKQYPGALNLGASLGTLAAARTGIEKGAAALVDQLKK